MLDAKDLCAAERRADKAFDSPQDFFIWITLGMPDKFEGMIEGERSRYAKRSDSVYDYFNWLTNGSVETAKCSLCTQHLVQNRLEQGGDSSIPRFTNKQLMQ